MDKIRACALANELVGVSISGWTVTHLINNGKSAAVFRATKDGAEAAIKIFDRELIERFGADTQLERIKRELLLRDEIHPNLVRIFDGGFDSVTENYFVAMEYLPFKSLEDVLQDVLPADIPKIAGQLASAARRLEVLGLVHRDIKPSNIIYHAKSKRLTLLDLGVLGPIGEAGNLTDVEGRPFIGTLQYSSPEYLLRQEDDSTDGWRALTFYQIGAVMHDLIMKKPIFQEFSEPYSRLVNAVQQEQPVIQSSAADPAVVELARKCLLKRPEVRLSLINWGDFERLGADSRSSAKERVTNRVITANAVEAESISRVQESRQRAEIEASVSRILRDAFRTIRANNSLFPPVVVVPNKGTGGVEARFSPSPRHGLPDGLEIHVRCNVIDPSEQVVILTGIGIGNSDEQEVVVFKGITDSGAIFEALEDYVYTVLDSAQVQANRD